MKRILILILLIFITSVNTSGVGINGGNHVEFSTYDVVNDQWTNLTISGIPDIEMYSVSSDDEFINNTVIEILSSPWSAIETILEEENFFNTILEENNPHTVISVSLNGEFNRQSISHINIVPEKLTEFFQSILSRVIGNNADKTAWPVDLSYVVMESYPEQYGVSVSIQRGNDLLTYVHEENATLIVTDYNPFNNENTINVIYSESIPIAIGSGGSTIEVNFKSFSVGTNYSPTDLHFSVIMDSGIYLYQSNDTSLPMIGNGPNYLINEVQKTLTSDVLPLSEYFIFSIILLPIIKKVKK